MTTAFATPQIAEQQPLHASIKQTVETTIDDLIATLPSPEQLSSAERRGMIARYTSVLEGNFIYWMTATLIATQAEEARPILLHNLYEEVRDAHPAMLRRFAIAAHACPTDTDALVVDEDLNRVRLFLGRLDGVQSLVTMAFFEGFIQRYMGYLAELARLEGSSEMEYTDVHGVCDIEHTEGLYRALEAEMAVASPAPEKDALEGVYLLRDLLRVIFFGNRESFPA